MYIVYPSIFLQIYDQKYVIFCYFLLDVSNFDHQFLKSVNIDISDLIHISSLLFSGIYS